MKTYQRFEALAAPTRLEIVEALKLGPRSVGEIAKGLPVSRPAVSQHLKVLRQAGFVTERQMGTKRIYSLDPAGLAELKSYLEGFWEAALSNFKNKADERKQR